MNKAVSRFIEEGDSVAMGAALEAAILFAVGHEIWTGERKIQFRANQISLSHRIRRTVWFFGQEIH